MSSHSPQRYQSVIDLSKPKSVFSEMSKYCFKADSALFLHLPYARMQDNHRTARWLHVNPLLYFCPCHRRCQVFKQGEAFTHTPSSHLSAFHIPLWKYTLLFGFKQRQDENLTLNTCSCNTLLLCFSWCWRADSKTQLTPN